MLPQGNLSNKYNLQTLTSVATKMILFADKNKHSENVADSDLSSLLLSTT